MAGEIQACARGGPTHADKRPPPHFRSKDELLATIFTFFEEKIWGGEAAAETVELTPVILPAVLGCYLAVNAFLRPLIKIHGYTAPGFEAVKAEFKRNFTSRGEIGAACTVYYRGQNVADLWGGYRDAKKRPLAKEYPCPRLFGNQGHVCTVHGRCRQPALTGPRRARGQDWPEFAQAGKENITVRQLLAHQAGLCVIGRASGRRSAAEGVGRSGIQVRATVKRQCFAPPPTRQKPLSYMREGLFAK